MKSDCPAAGNSRHFRLGLGVAILATGLSGVTAQVVLLRELLIVYTGNELSMGVVVSHWLVGEVFGCVVLARWWIERTVRPLSCFGILTFLFCLSLPGAISVTRVLRTILGSSLGEPISLGRMVASAWFVIFPVGMLHGSLFPAACRLSCLLAAKEDSSAIATVYIWETMGTLVGGLASKILFLPCFSSFQTATWLGVLNGIAGLALQTPRCPAAHRHTDTVTMRVLAVVLLVGSLAVGIQKWDQSIHNDSLLLQWKGQRVVHYQNSSYGNVCVLENDGQYTFTVNGVPAFMFPIPDRAAIEEFVHIPLVFLPAPQKVFFAGGGLCGALREVLRHPSIRLVECAELDPLLVELFRKVAAGSTDSGLNDPRVRISHVDGRRLLEITSNTYDVVWVGASEPSTLQANRFFTTEFFSLARGRLEADGILVLALPGGVRSGFDEERDLHDCMFRTLARVFPHVLVLPGEGNIMFLASPGRVLGTVRREELLERLVARGIYSNGPVPWHIEKRLHPSWQNWFTKFVRWGSRETNRDLHPLALYHSLARWNALYSPLAAALLRLTARHASVWVPILFFLIFMGGLVVVKHSWRRDSPVPWSVFFTIGTTGFAAMLLELAILLAFQSAFGYLFAWLGLLVAAFMGGAAAGASCVRGRCSSQ
ncbi:MAG: fused MFS/spermidine synthase, partial [Kiritimatiellae bacterium]|nr:fused MFS/spermidine synthase [Kiritimatiellia bacterium]